MSESAQAELALWQARVDDMQVALERLREERQILRDEIAVLLAQIEGLRLRLEHALSAPTPY
jgi:chromosome segregation ATPase